MAEYIPLYRKYRPQKIEEIVGQSHIKQALANAIKLGKISHAYLFTGPRGTGKTSTARILAKSLNCTDGPTMTPCGTCPSCQDIINGVPIDVIEIDAASNRKVEDAQNILEKIQYVPVNGKYKIYIIDEVHMLSNTAFNALLKTLEEPPQNVVFILATTESHKVLDTIKSRCQRFDFRRLTVDDITNHLRYIADKESIKITNEALQTIAQSSSGGMRDSIALLDQVSILGEAKEITEEDINNLLGRISFEKLYTLTEEIIASNTSNSIKLVEDIYSAGNEPVQILTNLMTYFKNLLVVKNCDKDSVIKLTNLNEELIKKLSTQADKLETHQIVFLIEKSASYIKEIKLTTAQQMWLDVSIIDLANLTNNTKLVELQARLEALEGGEVKVARPRIVVPPQAPTPVSVTANEPPKIEKAVTVEKDIETSAPIKKEVIEEKTVEEFSPMPKAKMLDPTTDLTSLWTSLLSNIKSKPTQSMLKLATPVKIASDEIILTFKQDLFVKRAEAKKDAIIEAANELFGQDNSVVTIRTPQASDAEIVQTTTITSIPKQVEPKPVEPKQVKTLVKETPEENIDDINDLDDIPEETTQNQQESMEMEADQSKMIKQLFDGKYIN